MNLEQYSVALTAALVLLTITTLASIISYVFSARVREYMHKQDYLMYMKSIGVLAVISTVGALVYQFVYLTPVCAYCWWQRIFMFPIDIVIAVSLWKKIRGNETIVFILALIGALFAGVHYYFHVRVQILGDALSMPCSSIGIIPSCTDTPVLIWGFVTIPLMALIVFISILWLSFLAMKSSKNTI